MSIYNPVPHQAGRRSVATQLRAIATMQLHTQRHPVSRYSLALSPAGNPSPDVALGCGVSNLVNRPVGFVSTAC